MEVGELELYQGHLPSHMDIIAPHQPRSGGSGPEEAEAR